MRRKRNPLPGVGMWLDVAWLWLDVLYTAVDLNSFICFFSANLSRTPCWSFAEPMLSNNSSYQDSFITCQVTPYYHGSLLHRLVNMQLASRNPLFRTGCCWLGNFSERLTGPTPSQNFRGTFAKIPLSADPSHQQGGASEEKANTRHLGVWLSQSLTFGSLPAAFGACFLRLQKATLGSTSGRCKDVFEDHGIWLWRSLTFGSLAATYAGKGKCRRW